MLAIAMVIPFLKICYMFGAMTFVCLFLLADFNCTTFDNHFLAKGAIRIPKMI